jgi:hypothetical protein
MYPHLTPHGWLMKLNRQPLTEMPAEELQADEMFWSAQMAEKTGLRLTRGTPLAEIGNYAQKVFARHSLSGFKGDARFITNAYSCRAWSKWRSSQAGVYAWRLGPQAPSEYKAKPGPGLEELKDATDLAFKQAFALCPASPEALYRYVNFLVQFSRLDDAILVARTSLACQPKDNPQASSSSSIANLITQLEKFKQQAPRR